MNHLHTGTRPRIAIGLVHYPTYDRQKSIVATNITNFDVHDIARAARTYGVDQYYLIHPMREQLMFVERLADHWRTGYGSKYNPSRMKALDPVVAVESVEKAFLAWDARLTEQGHPDLSEEYLSVAGLSKKGTSMRKELGLKKSLLVTTSARAVDGMPPLKFPVLRESLFQGKTSCFLLFGTGYGMTNELVQRTDVLLEPLKSQIDTSFNHLSVRSAVSICLDRLLGAW